MAESVVPKSISLDFKFPSCNITKWRENEEKKMKKQTMLESATAQVGCMANWRFQIVTRGVHVPKLHRQAPLIGGVLVNSLLVWENSFSNKYIFFHKLFSGRVLGRDNFCPKGRVSGRNSFCPNSVRSDPNQTQLVFLNSFPLRKLDSRNIYSKVLHQKPSRSGWPGGLNC